MTVQTPRLPTDLPRQSAFAKYQVKAWPYRFTGALHVGHIRGGIPGDPKVAEGWIRTKLGASTEALLHQRIAEVVAERGISPDDAVAEVNANTNVNGFKRDARGLYIEGRQLKAAIKEAACVAAATKKVPVKAWGETRKGILGFVAEHVCVVEDRLHLGVAEPSGIDQRFVHTWRGSGIQYEEYVTDATIHFTVLTDHKFTDEQWAMIWLTGEQQGIGATRSQGYGRYTVTEWTPIT